MRNYLSNLGVRSKLVLLVSGIVAVLLTAVLVAVWVESHQELERISETDAKTSRKAFQTAEEYRIRDRAHVAALIASNSAGPMKQGDTAQMCKEVQNILSYVGTDPNDSSHADYAVLQDEHGQILAIAIHGQPTCDGALKNLRLPDVRDALAKLPLMTNWEGPDQKIYSIYTARVKDPTSQQNLGTASVGFPLQDEAAVLAKARSGMDVVMWHEENSPSQVLEPHLFAVSDPRFTAALHRKLADAAQGKPFESEGDEFVLEQVGLVAPGVLIENPQHIHIGLADNVTESMRPFKALQRYLAVLAVSSLLLGACLALVLSRPIVKPLVGLAHVAREVEKGKYDGVEQLKVENRSVFESLDELGTLCRAFEDMIAGLNQSRAMSKFISNTAYNSLRHCGTCPSERKWMVVFFSDIRDFTSFSEGRDPENVVQRLNQVLGIQAQAIINHGGDIDKFIGDAVVAWFSGEDRCQRAVAAASEMLSELANRIGSSSGGQIGIGIHLGEVIVGAVGSPDRLDYTAIGSTVNLAARLCSAARRGQILISEAVVTELGNSVPLNPLPPITVKGFAEQIPVYEVLSEKASAGAVSAVNSYADAKVAPSREESRFPDRSPITPPERDVVMPVCA